MTDPASMTRTQVAPCPNGNAIRRRWRSLWLVYGLANYLLVIATIAYAIAFFGNIYCARTIDSVAAIPLGEALSVNLLLLLMFGVQHSGMARPAFKRLIARLIPSEAERSTYVLASSIATIAVMACWQPLGGLVWFIDDAFWATVVRSVYFAGWAIMIIATYLIDHWELFGVRQVIAYYRGEHFESGTFVTPALYRIVRHPIYLGWLLILWASPVMTVAHLVAALGLTVYILIGVCFEERDLARKLSCYRQYQRKVPMLIPSPGRRLKREEKPCP
jgi:protein-S-isoprenylcysteine O-methyltransferase Ste14